MTENESIQELSFNDDNSYEQKIALRQQRRRQIRKRRQRRKLLLLCILIVVAGTLLVQLITVKPDAVETFVIETFENELNGIDKPDWTVDYLSKNEYSRPGDTLPEVKNIFVHYTANPGTSAKQNRSYFEHLKDTHERSASAHFIIGYDGEILQCIPLSEIGYAVQTRNYDSISVECCYIDKDGSFTKETYDSLISLLAYLLQYYNLDAEDLLRHYDCGGKKCPLYYVDHPDDWEQLKTDVANKITNS